MTFKELLSQFGSWIFTGLTFLGFLLIYVGIGGRGNFKLTGEKNVYFVAIGIVLIIPFLIDLIKTKIMLDKLEDEEEKRINNLIANGDKIRVDLDNLEIQSNSYKQEIEVGNGYNSRNEYVDVNHNVVFINIPYKYDTINYKLNIDMDTTKLKMHFAIKKVTYLYIDSNNPSNYYLDLRFLESQINK